MPELYLIRFAQASFGADDYDKLSELVNKQSYALGKALASQGMQPDTWIMSVMPRHRETIEGIAKGIRLNAISAEIQTSLNEFNFTGLLNAKYSGLTSPEKMHTDRKTHFRILRKTVLEWQADDIENPPETWTEFEQRIEVTKKKLIMRDEYHKVLARSSGTAISQMTAAALQTPRKQQIRLQLQMQNCAVNRFIFTRSRFYVHEFNESRHTTQKPTIF